MGGARWWVQPYGFRAEGTAAATSGLDLGVVELEAGAFQRLDIIDFSAIKVEHAGGIDENLQISKLICLVEHAGLGFESHGIAETGTAAADNGNPQAGRLRILHTENFSDFANGIFSELNHIISLNARTAGPPNEALALLVYLIWMRKGTELLRDSPILGTRRAWRYGRAWRCAILRGHEGYKLVAGEG